jgi:hypothetical protein
MTSVAAQSERSGRSREHTVMTAMTYFVRGMELHDYNAVSLVPDAVRTGNGWDIGHDAKSLRDAGFTTTPVYVRTNKWIVQGSEAVAFSQFYSRNGGPPLCLAHYFNVPADRIKEILITFPGSQMPPDGFGAAVPPSPSEKPKGNALVEIADGFLKGLEAGSLASAKLGPDLLAAENCDVKGLGKDAALKHWQETWFGTITKITTLRWVVEPPYVVVSYRADARQGTPPLWATQYFRIYDGFIRETASVFGRGPTAEQLEAARTKGRNR